MVEYDVTNKHWPGCWRYASHHACAVAEIERLRADLEEWKRRAWNNQAETISLLNRIGRLNDALEE